MKRREFFARQRQASLVAGEPGISVGNVAVSTSDTSASITLFMCGDVMTGRGIDQVLPTPSDPRLYESYVKNTNRYVELAQSASGPFPRGVEFSY